MKKLVALSLGLWAMTFNPTDAAWPVRGHFPTSSAPPPVACSAGAFDLTQNGCNTPLLYGAVR